jgi:TolA-binding protein
MSEMKPKSFWSRPEGVTGGLVLGALILGGGFLIASSVTAILGFLATTLGLVISLAVLGLIIFMALDGGTRSLVSYMYKSVMRWITGMFIKLDPIAILKSYVDDLKGNLRKMNRQISQMRGQMHKLKEMIINNKKEITSNLNQASKAKDNNVQAQVILKSRKAGRLKESNIKLEDLYKKMEILYRVLNKMYENSSILVEDVQDQVMVKDQERKALLAGHSAMKSAMSVIKGDPDKRAMFDAALESVADDVSQKVGEMERFMEMSESFMQSVDLQNGVFEEEGLKMLEKWENEGASLILGGDKNLLINQANDEGDELDLDSPIREPEKVGRGNQYDHLFD